MPNNFVSCSTPGTDSTSSLAESRIAEDADTYVKESQRSQFLAEYLANKVSLRETLDMNQKAAHKLHRTGKATDLIFFPKLAKAIVFEPLRETFAIEPLDLGRPINTVGNKHILGFEVVEQQ